MAIDPKLQFDKLKGFPELNENDKIKTELFLESSIEIVSIIESFGKLFTPVVNDMKNNVEKIQKHYTIDTIKFMYLEDLVLQIEPNKPFNTVTEALLWLKRGLELIEAFFTNILNDTKLEDNLRGHLKLAYKQTLEPYHGFMVQQMFSVIYRWVPTRSYLIGSDDRHNENVKALQSFIPPFRAHLHRLNDFYAINNLDVNKKV